LKNQYFGDARDYFKYDVLECVLDADPVWHQLTCLWMLTTPDGSGQGKVSFVPDPELPELTEFFHERRSHETRKVSQMPMYLCRRGHRVFSYRDDREDFTVTSRTAYFDEIPEIALRRSVVFFDPDNGLEPPGRATERHLLFEELLRVFRRMDEASVAVVFQYRRRVGGFWEEMGSQIGDTLNVGLAYVAEPAVGFYVIPKDPSRLTQVEAALARVATRHTPHGRGRRRVGRVDGA
jgi:hypothetical protein